MCDGTAKVSSSVLQHVFGDAPLTAIVVAAYKLFAIRPELHQLVSTSWQECTPPTHNTPDTATAACLQLACGHSPLLLLLPVLSAVHSYCTGVAVLLHTPVVPLLHPCCAPIALVLHSYCTWIALLLRSLCIPIALYCTPTALPLHPIALYCTPVAHNFCCSEGCSCCPAVLSPMLLNVLLGAVSLSAVAVVCTVVDASQAAAACAAVLLPVLLAVVPVTATVLLPIPC